MNAWKCFDREKEHGLPSNTIVPSEKKCWLHAPQQEKYFLCQPGRSSISCYSKFYHHFNTLFNKYKNSSTSICSHWFSTFCFFPHALLFSVHNHFYIAQPNFKYFKQYCSNWHKINLLPSRRATKMCTYLQEGSDRQENLTKQKKGRRKTLYCLAGIVASVPFLLTSIFSVSIISTFHPIKFPVNIGVCLTHSTLFFTMPLGSINIHWATYGRLIHVETPRENRTALMKLHQVASTTTCFQNKFKPLNQSHFYSNTQNSYWIATVSQVYWRSYLCTT